MPETVHRQCTLCEAHCGIRVEVEGRDVLRITGDPDDVMSRGYICPKAAALADIYEDPDRLRRPVKRVGSEFVEIGWDEALDFAAAGIRDLRERYGRDSVATYLGNPGAHSSGLLPFFGIRALLRSANNYSASSVDQIPQHRVAHELFGSLAILAIPDIDRTSHMLLLGANPAVSNGSIMTAPGARKRLKAIAERGGRVVVVDPRRTETVAHATEHVQIRPGGDSYMLLGMLHTIFAEGLEDLGDFAELVDGLDELRQLAAEWPPSRATDHCGVEAATIERMAREFAQAPSAVAYGRVGVCHQRTGTITNWLIAALNIVTGNFDRPGGVMFPEPAIDGLGPLAMMPVAKKWGHRRQRVSGLPGYADEFPVAGMADEILTPGEGQVRGLITYAGNPVLSTPGGARLDEAIAGLEHYVAVDMYVTETTRHAHVILPPVSHLERTDVDLVMPAVSVRNHVRANPAAVPREPGGKTDWEIGWALVSRLGGGISGAIRNPLLRLAAAATTPERFADAAIRVGPYGQLRKGPRAGLTYGKVRDSVHGIDLGPLRPRMPGLLKTPGKRLRVSTPALLAEAARLEQLATESAAALSGQHDLILIGRRNLRSNNSWMHNSKRLMKGADRCVATLHPDEAERRGLTDGDQVRVSSAVGSIELPLTVSDEIGPGVVTVPHGFGHGRAGVGWQTAASHPGVGVNDITDPTVLDTMTGNAALSAVPVSVQAVVAPQKDRVAQAAALPDPA